MDLYDDAVLQVVYNLSTLKELRNFCMVNKNIQRICTDNSEVIKRKFIEKLFGKYNETYDELYTVLQNTLPKKQKQKILYENRKIDMKRLNWYKIFKTVVSPKFREYFADKLREGSRKNTKDTTKQLTDIKLQI